MEAFRTGSRSAVLHTLWSHIHNAPFRVERALSRSLSPKVISTTNPFPEITLSCALSRKGGVDRLFRERAIAIYRLFFVILAIFSKDSYISRREIFRRILYEVGYRNWACFESVNVIFHQVVKFCDFWLFHRFSFGFFIHFFIVSLCKNWFLSVIACFSSEIMAHDNFWKNYLLTLVSRN